MTNDEQAMGQQRDTEPTEAIAVGDYVRDIPGMYMSDGEIGVVDCTDGDADNDGNAPYRVRYLARAFDSGEVERWYYRHELELVDIAALSNETPLTMREEIDLRIANGNAATEAGVFEVGDLVRVIVDKPHFEDKPIDGAIGRVMPPWSNKHTQFLNVFFFCPTWATGDYESSYSLLPTEVELVDIAALSSTKPEPMPRNTPFEVGDIVKYVGTRIDKKDLPAVTGKVVDVDTKTHKHPTIAVDLSDKRAPVWFYPMELKHLFNKEPAALSTPTPEPDALAAALAEIERLKAERDAYKAFYDFVWEKDMAEIGPANFNRDDLQRWFTTLETIIGLTESGKP